MKITNLNIYKNGFALIELVSVIAVLAILSVFGIPLFQSIINNAKLAIAKHSLAENYKRCGIDRNSVPINPTFSGIIFESNNGSTYSINNEFNCYRDIKAKLGESCEFSLNMASGIKKNWPENFKSCKPQYSELEKLQNAYREDADLMIVQNNIVNGECNVCNQGTTQGDPNLDPGDINYELAVPLYDFNFFQKNLHMMKAAGLTCESKFIGSNWRLDTQSWREAAAGRYENIASGYVLIKGSSEEEFRLNAKKGGLRPVDIDTNGEREFLQNYYGRDPDHNNESDCQIAEVKFTSWDWEFESSYWRENRP
tara:strand:+ start:141 stop:1073 length:933 start_codon:yes stop_codon:yes gene_type:complete